MNKYLPLPAHYKPSRTKLTVLSAAVALALSAPPSFAATLIVTNTTDAGTPPGSLREAINNAMPGDTIIFDSSLSGQTITLDSAFITNQSLRINKNLTINGDINNDHIPDITIDGNQGNWEAFTVRGSYGSPVTVTLQGLNITNSNVEGAGGGISSYRADLTVTDCTVTNNSSVYGGGIGLAFGSLTVNNSTISGNQGSSFGGGIYAFESGTTLNNSTVSNNTTNPYGGSGGGGIASFGSYDGPVTANTLTLNNSTVSGNAAHTSGGGISVYIGSLSVNNSTISGNSTVTYGPYTSGGGIFTNEASTRLYKSTVSGNTSSFRNGGGIASYDNQSLSIVNSTLTLDSSTVSNNTAYYGGGGISANGIPVSVNDSTISGNTAQNKLDSSSGGGGIFTFQGSLSVSNSSLTGNASAGKGGRGGGISARYGSMSVTNSTVSGNTSKGFGAGIATGFESLGLSNSTVSGNSADGNGGGILVDHSPTLIQNSTITGNTSLNQGGGIHSIGSGFIVLNSTLASNTAASGGGGLLTDTPGLVQNSVIANNSSQDCYFTLVINIMSDHSWFGDATCTGTANGDPQLGALANNGGPTQTLLPLTGSGLIDAGNNQNCLATDQRGIARPQGMTCDIGAVEVEQVSNVPPVNDIVPAVSGTLIVGNALGANMGTWHDDDNDTLSYSYQWYRADDAGGTNAAAIMGANTNAYTTTGSDGLKFLRVAVTADDGHGHAVPAYSVWSAIAKADQTINPVTPTSVTYSQGGSFMLNATATSGLAVSFSGGTANVCTVMGSSVSILNAGSCNVTANQGGDSGYNPAPALNQTIIIGKADQTIGAITPSQSPVTYSQGGSFTVSATATSGLNVNFASTTPTTCTVNGTIVNILAAGNCHLTADQAGDGNYNPAGTVTADVTINKANTSTQITAPINVAVPNMPVNIPFTVTPATSGTPTGNVTISSDGTPVCSASVAQGQCSASFSSAGSKNLTALYAGDTNFSSSASKPIPYYVPDLLSEIVDTFSSSNWQGYEYQYQQKYHNPVLIVSPPSYIDPQHGVPRLQNVTTQGFDIRFQPWDKYSATPHEPVERMSVLVVEAGTYTFSDGSVLEAGTVDTVNGKASARYKAKFPGVPFLFMSVDSNNDPNAVTVKTKSLSKTQFTAVLEEEKGSKHKHGTEKVGYIALFKKNPEAPIYLCDQMRHLYMAQMLVTNAALNPVPGSQCQLLIDQDNGNLRYRPRTITRNISVLNMEGARPFAQVGTAIPQGSVLREQCENDGRD